MMPFGAWRKSRTTSIVGSSWELGRSTLLPPSWRWHAISKISIPTVVQLSPDVPSVVEWLQKGILVPMAQAYGLAGVSFDPFNAGRRSAPHINAGRNELPHWTSYLEGLTEEGYIREFAVPLNRTDLPETVGYGMIEDTIKLAKQLSGKNPPSSFEVDTLKTQIATVVQSAPESARLAITVKGNLGGVVLENVFDNLRNFTEEARSS